MISKENYWHSRDSTGALLRRFGIGIAWEWWRRGGMACCHWFSFSGPPGVHGLAHCHAAPAAPAVVK